MEKTGAPRAGFLLTPDLPFFSRLSRLFPSPAMIRIHSAWLLRIGCMVAVLSLPAPIRAGSPRAKARPSGPPVIRWTEGSPDSTLTKGTDGIYRYELSYEILTAAVSIDNQEIEKTQRTLEHVFRVLLSVRNRGTLPVDVEPQKMTLELADHFHITMKSEDPDELSARIQDDSDELVHQSERELKQYPERKAVVEARLREHEKIVAEWQEYLSAKTLRGMTLQPAQAEVSGLVFFPTRSKWRGEWKKEEHLILRLPIANVVLEFPFTLPPPGEVPQLRQRGDQQ